MGRKKTGIRSMKRVLVTGGGGFVGYAIVKSLVKQECEVFVAGRSKYPHVEKLGAVCMRGDISDSDFTMRSCKGIDTVFHTAAKAGIWGRWQDYRNTNITGTKNIVDACIARDVENLIYTSTPSVVFANKDIVGGDESLPYTDTYLCHYSKSKVIAERYVLANNNDKLRTCAIRPHLIWGPGDPHLVPRLLAKGKKGELKIVGSGLNRVDISYIDNVVHAHLLAAESLQTNGNAAGNAYFIGQESPVNLWKWINDLYGDLGIHQISKRVPFMAAYAAGFLLELIHRLQRNDNEPKMTRFLALQLARSHYFSHARASRDLGYKPIVSLPEGQNRLLHWLKTNDPQSIV